MEREIDHGVQNAGLCGDVATELWADLVIALKAVPQSFVLRKRAQKAFRLDLHIEPHPWSKCSMNLTDSREIAADRQTVWAAILDPAVLKECIPGCSELTGSVSEGYEATVTQKVGPVKATFKGEVTISDVVEGESLTISGQGKGGPAGFAKGEARVKLSDAEGGTLLEYDVDAKVGGKLAQLGSRIVDGFAKKLADQFFERFQNGLEPEEAVEDQSDEAEAEVKKGWIGRMFKG